MNGFDPVIANEIGRDLDHEVDAADVCTSCNGSGVWHSMDGRALGDCTDCDGEGWTR